MPRGGKRKGAGRPKGTGKFGEPTKAVRLPVSKIDEIMEFIERGADTYSIYESDSPIPKNQKAKCRLAEELVPSPESTFVVRMSDDSMKGAGIFPNDIMFVDKRLEPQNGDIVIILLNEILAVRRLSIKNKKLELKAENPKFKTIPVADADDIEIWGVVQTVVHPLAGGLS